MKVGFVRVQRDKSIKIDFFILLSTNQVALHERQVLYDLQTVQSRCSANVLPVVLVHRRQNLFAGLAQIDGELPGAAGDPAGKQIAGGKIVAPASLDDQMRASRISAKRGKRGIDIRLPLYLFRDDRRCSRQAQRPFSQPQPHHLL